MEAQCSRKAAPSGGCKIIKDDFTGDKTMTGGQCPPPLGANRLNSLKAHDFLFCVKIFLISQIHNYKHEKRKNI